MYEMRFKGSKVKKQFKILLQKLSQNVKERMREALENNPYPSPTYGSTRKVPTKIEKKGSLYCYEITGGDRILYDIIESPIKAVLIHYVGDDDGEIRYLKKYAR